LAEFDALSKRSTMHHILYGFTEGFRLRHRLASILRSSAQLRATDSIDPGELKLSGVSVLALDFDGVLASHGKKVPLPEAAAWLLRCCDVFGEENIYILSNKPSRERSAWFSANHPKIRFISGVKKKPYPDGLLKIISLSGAPPTEIMLLDDRLLTGVLATCLSGTSVTYITAPYINLRSNPLQELFFMLLRSAERLLLSLVKEV